MMETVLTLSFLILGLAVLLSLYRLARGPEVLDRVLAFDLISTCVVGFVVLLSLRWSTAHYMELILIFTLLGFLSAVAFVFYLHKTIPANPPPPKPEGRP